MKALVITAKELEYKSFRKLINPIEEIVSPEGTVYEMGNYITNGFEIKIVLAQTGMGNEKAAIETERAINLFKPYFVCLVGIAGGIKDVKLGDVVVADKIYSYESGKEDVEFMVRPDLGKSSYSFLQRAKAEVRTENWKKEGLFKNRKIDFEVIVGNICAGEKILSSKESALYIFIKKNYNDTTAIEMEGSGFIKAVYSNNKHIEAAVIRGISDLLDNKSVVDSQGFQEIAANNASLFALHLLCKMALDFNNSENLNSEFDCRYSITLAGNIDSGDKSKLDLLLFEIMSITNDYSIKLEKVGKGSIKIFLRGSKIGFRRIHDLYQNGELDKILNYSVLGIETDGYELVLKKKRVTLDIIDRVRNLRTGTVKFYNTAHGFGFIKDADSGNEYFVHVSSLKDQIKENDEVTFEILEDEKGGKVISVIKEK